jgi:hypothetical protein
MSVDSFTTALMKTIGERRLAFALPDEVAS